MWTAWCAKSNRHIARLQAGACTIEYGFVLDDLLTNYERIADHCSNIAVAMIEVSEDRFDTHEYLNHIKTVKAPVLKSAMSATAAAIPLSPAPAELPLHRSRKNNYRRAFPCKMGRNLWHIAGFGLFVGRIL